MYVLGTIIAYKWSGTLVKSQVRVREKPVIKMIMQYNRIKYSTTC